MHRHLVTISLDKYKLICIRCGKLKHVIAAGTDRDMSVFSESILRSKSVDCFNQIPSLLSGLGIIKHINLDKLYVSRHVTLYNGKITDDGVSMSISKWVTLNGIK